MRSLYLSTKSFIASSLPPSKGRDRWKRLIHNEPAMKDFRKLKVWERAHQFVLAVYRLRHRFHAMKLTA
jgi:hypothetical protein